MSLLFDLYLVSPKLVNERLRHKNTTCQDIIAKLACTNLSSRMFALQSCTLLNKEIIEKFSSFVFSFLVVRVTDLQLQGLKLQKRRSPASTTYFVQLGPAAAASLPIPSSKTIFAVAGRRPASCLSLLLSRSA